MKTFRIRSEAPVMEKLEITAESELGFHVKITRSVEAEVKEYRDFISRNLFEALLKTGYLQSPEVG